MLVRLQCGFLAGISALITKSKIGNTWYMVVILKAGQVIVQGNRFAAITDRHSTPCLLLRLVLHW